MSVQAQVKSNVIAGHKRARNQNVVSYMQELCQLKNTDDPLGNSDYISPVHILLKFHKNTLDSWNNGPGSPSNGEYYQSLEELTVSPSEEELPIMTPEMIERGGNHILDFGKDIISMSKFEGKLYTSMEKLTLNKKSFLRYSTTQGYSLEHITKLQYVVYFKSTNVHPGKLIPFKLAKIVRVHRNSKSSFVYIFKAPVTLTKLNAGIQYHLTHGIGIKPTSWELIIAEDPEALQNYQTK
jgi:hypothetical protein